MPRKAQIGEKCKFEGFGDTCASGLSCQEFICLPPNPTIDHLLTSIKNNNNVVTAAILKKKPSLVNEMKDNKTPLHQAAIHENGAGLIRLLLQQGAKRSKPDINNATALIHAVSASLFQNVLALVEPSPGNDPAINAQTKDGSTALMCSKDPEITALLLEAGADPSIKNYAGKNALDLAPTKAIRELLTANGARERAAIIDRLPKVLYNTATIALGEGAFGKVYKVDRNGVPVALKRMVIDKIIDKNAPGEFIHEIDGLQKVANSNYAMKYINSQQNGAAGYIVTELLSGADLYHAIGDHTINDTNIQQITRDLLQGLDELHSRGILHLDIKPENIRVFPDKKEKTIKYMDFGFWCDRDFCVNVEGRGTEGYSRPLQQTMFRATYDKTSDFYGLARSLVDILVGFPDTDEQDKYVAHVITSIHSNKPWTSTEAFYQPAISSEMQTWLAGVIYKLLYLTNEQKAVDALRPIVGGLRRTKKRFGRRSIRRRLN